MTLSLLKSMAHSASRNVLVLEVDLVVQEGHDQTGSRTTSSALLALVASHGVIRVHGSLALLVQTAQHSMCVVREEALSVEDRRQALGAGVERHGLALAVAVDLADGVEAIAQSLAVGGETANRQHYRGVVLRGRGAANLEDLG